MDKYFLIQTIISFIVGGVFVTFLSFLAERVKERFSGIILTFPSTLSIGFFFLGWTLGPQKVAVVIPVVLISLGLAILFTAVYFYTALVLRHFNIIKTFQIVVAFCMGTLTWFILVSPFVIKKFSSLTIGICGYLLLITITHILLHLKKSSITRLTSFKYSLSQKIGRALFVGSLIVIVVIFGKLLNPFWGGVFAMYPAAIASTLVIFHWYYDADKLLPVVKKIPIGSLSLFVYAMVSMFSFRYFGFILGTIASCSASLLSSFLIGHIIRKTDRNSE